MGGLFKVEVPELSERARRAVIDHRRAVQALADELGIPVETLLEDGAAPCAPSLKNGHAEESDEKS